MCRGQAYNGLQGIPYDAAEHEDVLAGPEGEEACRRRPRHAQAEDAGGALPWRGGEGRRTTVRSLAASSVTEPPRPDHPETLPQQSPGCLRDEVPQEPVGGDEQDDGAHGAPE